MKIKSISFNHSRSSIHFIYFINNEPLEQVQNFKDVGVFLYNKLTFDACKQCKKIDMLGLNTFFCGNLNNVNVLLFIYNSFVRSTLDYCTIM